MTQMNLFATAKKKATRKTAKSKSKKPVITAALKRKAKKEGGITVKKSGTVGSSSLVHDRKRSALTPGYRLSRTGKLYYESRKNRSDKAGRK